MIFHLLEGDVHRPGPIRTLPACLTASLVAVSLVAAGTPDLKSYPSPDLKDQAYHQSIHRKVGASWARPGQTPKEGSKSVVIVTILRDGSLMEPPRLHHKSGLDAWDASALDAVKKAAPFGALPKNYTRTSLEIHFHFEYN